MYTKLLIIMQICSNLYSILLRSLDAVLWINNVKNIRTSICESSKFSEHFFGGVNETVGDDSTILTKGLQ